MGLQILLTKINCKWKSAAFNTIQDILPFCFKKIKQKNNFKKSQWNGKESSSFPSIPSQQQWIEQLRTALAVCLCLVSHSRTNWDTQAASSTSPNCSPRLQPPRDALPSPVCPPALPASSCQPGFATFTLQTEQALFSVSTTNRCIEMEMHESHQAGSRRSVPSNLGQPGRIGGVRKDQRWAAADAGTPSQPLPRDTGFISDLALVVLQQICPLNTQLETSLREQKPRSKRNTNYCFDLDSYLGLSLLVWKWKSQGLRFKQIKYKLLLP